MGSLTYSGGSGRALSCKSTGDGTITCSNHQFDFVYLFYVCTLINTLYLQIKILLYITYKQMDQHRAVEQPII